jgi:hypothetical protein
LLSEAESAGWSAEEHSGSPVSDVFNRIEELLREAIAALDQQQREIERLKHLEAEYYFLRHRDYDENCSAAFANRRDLARKVAKAWLQLSPEDTAAMVDAAVEHGASGGSLLNWYLARLRADLTAAKAALAQVEQERDRLRDILMRRQNYAGDDRFGETR